LVEVIACGLCGSDVEKVRDPDRPAGRVLGHEVVGRLGRRGPGAAAGAPDPRPRVALAHHVPCGRCERCRTGHSSLCEQFTATDLQPGGFAEWLAVSPLHLQQAVAVLPPAVDDVSGTLFEPLSCVLRAIDTAVGLRASYPLPGVGPDEVRSGARPNVLVAGCGSVGLLFLAVLRARREAGSEPAGHLCAANLLFMEPDPERAALAGALGARPFAVGDGARPTIAFVTAPAALSHVVDVLEPGGVIVVFASPGGLVGVDMDALYRRELTLAGVRSGSPAHLRRAMALLASGRLQLDWLQSEVVPFDGLPAAFEDYACGRTLKVVAYPGLEEPSFPRVAAGGGGGTAHAAARERATGGDATIGVD
jgi:L-iditol 2-dehydrogenase